MFRWDCKHYVKIVNISDLIRWCWPKLVVAKTKQKQLLIVACQISSASWMFTRIMISQWETVNIHNIYSLKNPLVFNLRNASKRSNECQIIFEHVYIDMPVIYHREKISSLIGWQLTCSSNIQHFHSWSMIDDRLLWIITWIGYRCLFIQQS